MVPQHKIVARISYILLNKKGSVSNRWNIRCRFTRKHFNGKNVPTYRVLLYVFFISVRSSTCQSPLECNRYSDSPQCFAGEICNYNYKCHAAIQCSRNDDCEVSKTVFKTCISGFCQESFCLKNGQCVHGQKCSSSGKCAYPVIIRAEQNQNAVLVPPKKHNNKYCNERCWFKYIAEDNYPQLVHVKNGDSLKYFGDFCFKNSSPCNESTKAEINTVTGDLTIYKLQLADENNYYYFCGIPRHWPQYKMIRLEVYVAPRKEDLLISGLKRAAPVGTKVEVTCTINKIRPIASYMYWILNGQKVNASEYITTLNDDGTFRQHINLNYTFEDHRRAIQCVIIPAYGSKVAVDEDISILHAPIGKPKVIPPYINKYENEEITLLCKIDPTASGHPRCANYIWIKYGNQRELFPKSIENKNEFKFIMNEKSEGRYVCKCENEYGQSQASEASTVWLIKSTSAIVPRKEDMFIRGVDGLVADISAELTCTIKRIKPEANDMYWKLNDKVINSSVHTVVNSDGNSLSQYIKLIYKFGHGLNGGKLQCISVPVWGNTVTITETLHITHTTEHASKIEWHFKSILQPKNILKITLSCAGLIIILLFIVWLIKKMKRSKTQSPTMAMRMNDNSSTEARNLTTETLNEQIQYRDVTHTSGSDEYLTPLATHHYEVIPGD